jgi:hypothetical protein
VRVVSALPFSLISCAFNPCSAQATQRDEKYENASKKYEISRVSPDFGDTFLKTLSLASRDEPTDVLLPCS